MRNYEDNPLQCLYLDCTNVARRRGMCDKHRTQATKGIAQDRAKVKTTGELAILKLKYADALRMVEKRDRELAAVNVLSAAAAPMVIMPTYGSGTSEATPVLV